VMLESEWPGRARDAAPKRHVLRGRGLRLK
jgi:hypothetical protein